MPSPSFPPPPPPLPPPSHRTAQSAFAPPAGVAATFFGKHPAFPAFIDSGGLLSDALTDALQRIWKGGLHPACDVLAHQHAKHAGTSVVPHFSHDIYLFHAGHTTLGRIWNSTDATGRLGYPMGVLVHAMGVDGGWAIEQSLPRLAAVEHMCRDTRSAELVRLSLGEARRQIEDAMIVLVGLPRPIDTPIDLLAELQSPTAAPAALAALAQALQQAFEPTSAFAANSPMQPRHGIHLALPRLLASTDGRGARLWAAAIAKILEEQGHASNHPDFPILILDPAQGEMLHCLIGNLSALARADAWLSICRNTSPIVAGLPPVDIDLLAARDRITRWHGEAVAVARRPLQSAAKVSGTYGTYVRRPASQTRPLADARTSWFLRAALAALLILLLFLLWKRLQTEPPSAGKPSGEFVKQNNSLGVSAGTPANPIAAAAAVFRDTTSDVNKRLHACESLADMPDSEHAPANAIRARANLLRLAYQHAVNDRWLANLLGSVPAADGTRDGAMPSFATKLMPVHVLHAQWMVDNHPLQIDFHRLPMHSGQTTTPYLATTECSIGTVLALDRSPRTHDKLISILQADSSLAATIPHGWYITSDGALQLQESWKVDHPFTAVTFAQARDVALLLHCRIPTDDDWMAAWNATIPFAISSRSLSPLRGSFWTSQRTRDHNVPDMSYDLVEVNQCPGNPFRGLSGNVAEWIQTALLTDVPRIAGPSQWADESVQSTMISSLTPSQARSAFSDVGFRLALDVALPAQLNYDLDAFGDAVRSAAEGADITVR